jgi:5-formyltetrahydrofolate cyclo-ligase
MVSTFMNDSLTKAAIRAAALARRDQMTAAERAIASAFIAQRAEAVLAETRPRLVGAYRAFASEADPAPILAACEAAGIAVALPVMADRDVMLFRAYRLGDPLELDALRILAPAASAALVDPDLLLAPVTAFDRCGMRIGKGRGVYDRAIGRMRARGLDPLLVGIAFSVQEVPAIPAEPHDIRLDWIVTEKLTLHFPESDRGA